MKILTYNSVSDLFKTLFNFKHITFLTFFTSFVGVITHFIESYIWADMAQFTFLIILVLVDFLTGLAKAHKFKMIVPSKLPRFLLTILSYTFFLYVAFTGSNIIPFLAFLPTIVFAVFVLTTLLSITQNIGSLGWLPKPITTFIETNIGMKIEELLKIDISDISNEYDEKIEGLLADVYNYTDAKGVFLIGFQNYNKFQQNKIVGKLKYDIGTTPYNFEEVLSLNDLDVYFDCLGIRPDCIKKWDITNNLNLSETYIFKLDGITNSILSPIVVVDCKKIHQTELENETLKKLRISMDKLVVIFNKKYEIEQQIIEVEEKATEQIKEVNQKLEIPEDEKEDNFDQIGDLFNKS